MRNNKNTQIRSKSDHILLERAEYHQIILNAIEFSDITPHQLTKEAGLPDKDIKAWNMNRSVFIKLEKAYVKLMERSYKHD